MCIEDHDMNKIFNFKTAQRKWYAEWEKAHLFEAKPDSLKTPWSIVIPPPNITGNLHMGHALVFTLHDILTRFKRAQNYDALWVPGIDHAGIATQILVERELQQSEKKTRNDLGRELFTQRLWDWKRKNQDNIENQLKVLGASVDWTRNKFTMDPELNVAVRKVFVSAYKEGRIFKGSRMIQWDPISQTALSDLEVKYEERQGHLWYIRYKFTDNDEYIVVATTRPETILGDVGIAINPNDKRYNHLIGKTLKVPITNRIIPIITDSSVDETFGTGCVKLTPAHDLNDYIIGKKNNLPHITVIGFDARMTNEAGQKYTGLDRFECREKIVNDLKMQNYIEKIEPYVHQIAISDRSGAILEPLVSEQWFMKMDKVAQKALIAVKTGQIKFTPKKWEVVWEHWLNNIQDWCISRQIWWGHRIPAWQCQNCNYINVAEITPNNCEKCNSNHLIQDPDTLDTWFSSALWPFSVFGWPQNTNDLKRYYPTNVLITGYDILFFWVARMVMASIECTNTIPFKEVYFNALVRDEYGLKMSKSKGNVIDPVITIENYGADALRHSLAIMAAPGTDIALSHKRLEASKKFCNKLWNAARFIHINFTPDITLKIEPELTEADYWMIKQLHTQIHATTIALDEFRFHEATDIIYHLIWNDFCATYIELIKTNLAHSTVGHKSTVLHIFDIILRTLHPIMPFITEEIYSIIMLNRLKQDDSKLLAGRTWPINDSILQNRGGTEELIPCFQETLSTINKLRNINNMANNKKTNILCTIKKLQPLFDNMKKIANLSSITLINKEPTNKQKYSIAITTYGTVFLELDCLVDSQNKLQQLLKEKNKLMQELSILKARLSDNNFKTKAPKHIIAKMQMHVDDKIKRLAHIETILS